MHKLLIISSIALLVACSEDTTDGLNSGGTIDSGEPCDPATDFFCVDTPDAGFTIMDASDGKGTGNGKGDAGQKPDDKADGGDKPGGNGKTLYRHGGQLNTTTQSGEYILEAVNEGTVDCMIVFDLTSATEDTSCPSTQCDFAWAIELGTKTTSIAGSTCAFFGDDTGDMLLYGHREPSQLVIEKQGAWTDFGNSKVTGDVWEFDFEYSF